MHKSAQGDSCHCHKAPEVSKSSPLASGDSEEPWVWVAQCGVQDGSHAAAAVPVVCRAFEGQH